MKRTLDALKGSPSPSLLEIRILTNHGNDPRFSSFLRRDGKWRAYWEAMKAGPDPSDSAAPTTSSSSSTQPSDPQGSSTPHPTSNPALAAGGLVDYDDSSDENENDDLVSSKPLNLEETEPPADNNPSSSTNRASEADEKDNPIEPRSETNNDSERTPESEVQAPLQTTRPTLPIDNDDGEEEAILLEQLQPSTLLDPIPTPKTVDPIERLNRQQRAKLWAQNRKKSAPVRLEPALPTTSS
ncbi:hypothetical protein PGTUg99_013203 [Puccinia graminis f. sp. tritici]|uniref:Uncharacterized protein n=1 Tax=Puccinia graminis f. sp. tritici TaxID=56615 RepID=A0A5B0S5L0_PUCGR|nr:hypothetical protein PGTUg99_013203 [Puccinia graminis f. sp. tritici]